MGAFPLVSRHSLIAAFHPHPSPLLKGRGRTKRPCLLLQIRACGETRDSIQTAGIQAETLSSCCAPWVVAAGHVSKPGIRTPKPSRKSVTFTRAGTHRNAFGDARRCVETANIGGWRNPNRDAARPPDVRRRSLPGFRTGSCPAYPNTPAFDSPDTDGGKRPLSYCRHRSTPGAVGHANACHNPDTGGGKRPLSYCRHSCAPGAFGHANAFAPRVAVPDHGPGGVTGCAGRCGR